MNLNPHNESCRPAILLLTALFCLCLCLTCGGDRQPAAVPPTPPVVIVALDGLSWQVARPLVEAGEMPTLAGLMAGGAAGRLATHRPTWTPVLFTTMATGKLPEEHGIGTFVSEAGIPLTSNLRRVPALWTILSNLELPTLFYGWPVTWPAEMVTGEMISDRWHKTLDRPVHPAGWDTWLTPALAVFDNGSDMVCPGLDGLDELACPDRVSPWLHGAFEGGGAPTADEGPDKLVQLTRRKVETGFLWNVALDSEVKLPLFLRRLREVRPRLAAVYCNATDMSQHFFGGADRPGFRPRPERNPQGRQVIEETYRVYDRLLGRLVQGIREIGGYRDCVFIVLSDHGIDLASDLEVRVAPPADDPAGALRILGDAAVVQPPLPESPWHRIRFDPGSAMGRRSALLNRLDLAGCRFHPDDVYLYFVHEEAPPGVVVVSGDRLVPGQTISGMSVSDVAPTVLALLGLPSARDMAGRPASILLAGDGGPLPLAESTAWVETHGAARAPTSEQAIATPEDEDIREELRALGYID